MTKFAIILPLLAAEWTAAISAPRGTASAASTANYAPIRVSCPDRQQWIRPPIGISDEEAAWVNGRKQKVLQSLNPYLNRLNLDGFDTNEYIRRLTQDPSSVPTVTYSISGGGWGSALTGTGPLRAFDDRFPPSVEQRTGGILQILTYFSGLSGGSWIPMSLATNNFPTVEDMVSSWHVNETFWDRPSDNVTWRATAATMFSQLRPKFEAGFNLSLADFAGRAMAYEYVAGPAGGIATTVSGIKELSNFRNHEMPLPMWIGAEITDQDPKYFGIPVVNENATYFEWSPFEFGARDGPYGTGFIPMKYLGTKFVDGIPHGDCITEFDKASFMLGMAADAFNFWLIEDLSNLTAGDFAKRDDADTRPGRKQRRQLSLNIPEIPLEQIMELNETMYKLFGLDLNETIFASLPNPFASKGSIDDGALPPLNLTLVDGAETKQALPLWPLIQPSRNPDFLIAWDGVEDSHPYNWNNGTNLYATYHYASNASIPFPIVPPPATFVNRGYLDKPVFFGCDANTTNTNDTRAPIVLFLSNAPYSSYANISLLQATWTDEQMAAIMINGFNYITQGNSTLDREWPECLGCAVVDRSLAKVGLERTRQCVRCFTEYCWDGVEDNENPPLVDLTLRLDPSVSYAEWNQSYPYYPVLGGVGA